MQTIAIVALTTTIVVEYIILLLCALLRCQMLHKQEQCFNIEDLFIFFILKEDDPSRNFFFSFSCRCNQTVLKQLFNQAFNKQELYLDYIWQEDFATTPL